MSKPIPKEGIVRLPPEETAPGVRRALSRLRDSAASAGSRSRCEALGLRFAADELVILAALDYPGQGPGIPRHAALLQRRPRFGRPGGDGHAAAARPADGHGPLLRGGHVRLRRELPPRPRAAPGHARGQPGRRPQPRRLSRPGHGPLRRERPLALPGARRPARRVPDAPGPGRELCAVLLQRPDARPEGPDPRRLLGADRPRRQVRHGLDGLRGAALGHLLHLYRRHRALSLLLRRPRPAPSLPGRARPQGELGPARCRGGALRQSG